MKLKIFTLILICLSVSQNLISQELITYKSKDENFVYQYFENSDMERIYHGDYKENYKNWSTKGYFIDNQKNGNWSYIKKENYRSNFNDGYYNREISGNYINDKKNGKWTYKYRYDYKNKKFNSIINFDFKNDTIIGDVELINEDGFNGKLDSLGNFTGIWKKNVSQNEEIIYEFHKNFVIKILRRSLVTGDIYEKYLPNREEIISKIDEILKNNIKLLKGATYSNGYFRGNDKYRFEETNLGYELLGKFVSNIITPMQEAPVQSQRSNIINVNFLYKSPVFLIVREKEDYGFKKFLNLE